MDRVIFHLAFPVGDLEEARRFYVEELGCVPGRASSHALVLEFYGHQIVAQLTTEALEPPRGIYPRHFGVVLRNEREWQACADRAEARGLHFFQKPRQRYTGTRLEHRTFFLEDPFHNLLEFKHYTFESAIFGECETADVGDREAPR